MKTSFFVPIEAAPKGSKVAFHTGNGKIAMRIFKTSQTFYGGFWQGSDR